MLILLLVLSSLAFRMGAGAFFPVSDLAASVSGADCPCN
jgi:hypothetical protein